MNENRRLEKIIFQLFESAERNNANVTIDTSLVNDTNPIEYLLLSRSWLLLVGNLISRVDKFIFDLSKDTLKGKLYAFSKYGAWAGLKRGSQTGIVDTPPSENLLARFVVYLMSDNPLKVNVEVDFLNNRGNPNGFIGLMITNSFDTACSLLPEDLRNETLYALGYGLDKWQYGRPSTTTWNFNEIQLIVAEGKTIVKGL